MKQILIVVMFYGLLASCKKFVEVGQPANQLAKADVFANDATATAAILAVYAQLEAGMSLMNVVAYTGLSSDEFGLNSTTPIYIELHTNNIAPGNSFSDGFWSKYYQLIYQSNAILEGIKQSSTITEPVKKQLKGEAKFIRAYCYFNLVNIYGGVPLVTQTDYAKNARVKRAAINEVYDLMVADLTESCSLLTDEYKSPTNTMSMERTRPNKSAAFAMLAKIHLYRSDWGKAESMADSVLSKTTTYNLMADPATVFLKASKEQIWQVQAVLPNFNTFTGFQLILTGTPTSVYLDKRFVNNFDATDKRRTSWINIWRTASDSFYFAYKYRAGVNAGSVTEYTSLLRLGEVILIKAEALAIQNKLATAELELNKIRIRAGLTALSGLTQAQLQQAIQQERLRELFAENGSRWFDLKRTGTANAVLSALKGTNWTATDALYPIPLTELQRNSFLEQNPGY